MNKYRTLLRIVSLYKESNLIGVIILNWNPYKVIYLLMGTVPKNLHSVLKPGVRLFAYVNLKVEKASELLFEQFELALEPDENDGLV